MVELDNILKYEEIHWHQPPRFKWLKEGNGNTRFFHKVANGRKRKNLIPRLMVNGNEVESFEEISSEAIHFFLSYTGIKVWIGLVSNLFENQLTDDMRKELEVPISMEEVRKAIFSMKKDKALGLDGYSIRFFR